MPHNDPLIRRGAALRARMFQAVYPVVRRLQYSSPELRFATKPVAGPRKVTIPTRHGNLAALVYSPAAGDILRQKTLGMRPPVHLITHGGAFIIRVPGQEDNVARYLASEIGAFVVIPDYDTAPAVRFPVAEQEAYDAFRWVHDNGAVMGWDGDRVSVGGASGGGKLALNVALQAIDDGANSTKKVAAACGAGSVCGRCRHTVRAMLDAAAPESNKRPLGRVRRRWGRV